MHFINSYYFDPNDIEPNLVPFASSLSSMELDPSTKLAENLLNKEPTTCMCVERQWHLRGFGTFRPST